MSCKEQMKDSNEMTIFRLINALSKFRPDITIAVESGDNCIKNLHLGRYIVGYMVGNLVLQPHASGAVKRDF